MKFCKVDVELHSWASMCGLWTAGLGPLVYKDITDAGEAKPLSNA